MPNTLDLKARGDQFYFVLGYLSCLLRSSEFSYRDVYRFAAVANCGLLTKWGIDDREGAPSPRSWMLGNFSTSLLGVKECENPAKAG